MGVICLHCPARISRQLGQMERPPNKFLIHGDWDENGKFGDENGENNGHILNIRRFGKTLKILIQNCNKTAMFPKRLWPRSLSRTLQVCNISFGLKITRFGKCP